MILNVDTLKTLLKEIVFVVGWGGVRTDLIWLFDGNDPSNSVKDGEFLGAMFKY